MNSRFDCIVVGGGIIGMATAFYLSRQKMKVAICEKGYIGSGSTGRCIGGIRQQFSTPSTIRLMKENIQLFKEMEETFGFPVEFCQSGYLLLAHTEEMKQVFARNVKLQQEEGVRVSLLTPQEVKERFPHVCTDGLLTAAYCPDDGQAFPFAILKGYRAKIVESQGSFFLHNPVVEIKKAGRFSVCLGDGTTLEGDKVLMSAGPWTGELAARLGMNLPLFPERHEALITERIPRCLKPMLVDYRPDGCYFQQLVTGQIIGCYTPNPPVPGINHDVSFDFIPEMAWRMSRLLPVLQYACILRHWSGCYNMTPDGNPIIDRTDIDNLYVAAGMCGHGFMFAPAIGKHLAHFMVSGQWDTDFSDFSLHRSFAGQEKLK